MRNLYHFLCIFLFVYVCTICVSHIPTLKSLLLKAVCASHSCSPSTTRHIVTRSHSDLMMDDKKCMTSGNDDKSLEKQLMELTLAGNLEGIQKILKDNKTNVDCVDDGGMTPLQQAAFRGNYDMCKYLLEKGANVNSDKHENKYSALMFGALSGSEEVVRLLLDAGADPNVKNSVNRTAAEMGAFVSQHQVVGIINNFLPSKDLLRFTEKTGLETRSKLRKDLLHPFHKLLTGSNLHPIHIILYLKDNPALVEESRYLQQILDKLVLEKMSPHDTHESLAIQLHYLSCILGHVASSTTGIQGLLKKLAKGRENDGFLENVEKLVRSTLRSFPKPESNLFCMLLQRLSKVEIGSHPSAVIALSDSIQGTRMRAAEDHECDICGALKPKQCTRCHQAWYCGSVCQKLHWPTHKKVCKTSK